LFYTELPMYILWYERITVSSVYDRNKQWTKQPHTVTARYM